MNEGGPRLVMLARLSEAVRWDDAVRRSESDAWAHMRRKLSEMEAPLRAYKQQVFSAAKARLLADLSLPLMPPGALQAHKEVFEALLPIGEFADLAFHLEPGADRESRREGAVSVLASARAPTLFDYESLPPERRGRAWDKRVAAMAGRLDVDRLTRIAERGEMTPAKRARVARRLRRNLREYLSVTRGEGPLRDEITPFMLARIEEASAACLRLLNRWR
ncbi:MAG: hypothetical protein ACHQ49_13560 [Elusimicrobiota bacterium]